MKTIIATDQAPSAVGPYSQAVEINGMLFISGQIPIDPEIGTVIEGDIQAQTDRIKKMAEQGKITNEEAERLIEALIKSAESEDNKGEEKNE